MPDEPGVVRSGQMTMLNDERYWNSVATRWRSVQPQRLWRTYCDAVNSRLVEGLVGEKRVARALKTDLFDEATSAAGVIPVIETVSRTVCGVDLSHLMCRAAAARHPTVVVAAADVRSLPFADASFDLVVSNSTLDHFRSRDDIEIALREIARILRPSGQLLLTLDNLGNPFVAVRNALPQGLLQRLHLVPYFVGATCGPRRLRQMLERAGLRTRHLGAMMHCPRLPAVAAAAVIGRWGGQRSHGRFVRSLMAWEALERLPTRYLSGYFITALADRASR